MCGLFGAHSTSLSDNEVENVKLLGHISGIRGMDSTGVVLASRFKKAFRVSLEKDTIDPCNFFGAKQDLFKQSVSTIVGHCRAATIGAVTRRNAHPYHFGKIVGVHNGTIPALSPKEPENDRTDSSVLYEKIDREGVVNALEQARSGAYALAWVNVQESTLNFIRNDARPLWFIRSKANTYYWASEKRILQFLANGNGAFEEPWMVKANCLIRFRLGHTEYEHQENFVPERVYSRPASALPKREWCGECLRGKEWCVCDKKAEADKVVIPFLPKKTPSQTTTTTTDSTGGKSSTTTSGTKRLKKHVYRGSEYVLCNTCHLEEEDCKCPGTFDKSKPMEVIDHSGDEKKERLVELYVGYNDRQYTIKEAHKELACGCAWCTEVSTPWDRVTWTEPGTYFCSKKGCEDAVEQMYPPMHSRTISDTVELDE